MTPTHVLRLLRILVLVLQGRVHLVLEPLDLRERDEALVAAPHAREAHAALVEDGDGALGELERLVEGRLLEGRRVDRGEVVLVVGCHA